ncbi:sigma-70 family RNA polymerase sigma factor [Leifsonia shinshuensis]|uniref:DNA-directed RNA polymerase specialized sigma subunit n=1 Tax=Leifsonia shinshuensis TaxID=150026 RepID=A0A853CRJ6_9MICO|nr:DNA-directed RNA polymerase specialized sigma subunit [Leifsonia shinshuensis]
MNRSERNTLVVDNLPLVGYLVSDLCSRATHLSRDDLASAGAVALVTAADAYDASTGVPFGAYARTRIVGALADELRAGDWATRSARKRIKATLAVQESLTAALGRTPAVEEIAR